MKGDLILLYDKSDKVEADLLVAELEMLGVDVQSQLLPSAAKAITEMEKTTGDYAVTLLFLSEQLAQEIGSAGIDLSKSPKESIVIGFQVTQSTQTSINTLTKGVVFSARKTTKALASDVLDEIGKKKLDSRLQVPNGIDNLWRTPLYIFRKPDGLKTKEILIDVTWSAKPTRPDMAPSLGELLAETIKHLGGKSLNILDFGAGKLRHTIPLLEEGHIVDAVEYRALFHDPSPQVQQNLAKAKTFGNKFTKVHYPSQFIKLKRTYDLVMLVNVLNVMPEPLERLFVLARCNNALSKGGHLLWFCQHGDVTQLNAVPDKVTDGGCTEKLSRKTFYKDYKSKEEVRRLMKLMGFEQAEEVNVDAGKNHALLFRKKGEPAIDVDKVVLSKRKVLERKLLKGSTPDESAIADVLDGKIYTGYGAAMSAGLELIRPGKVDAYKYENLMVGIIEYLFSKDFRYATIETQYPIHHGRQRIDIKTDWKDGSSLKGRIIDNGLKSAMVPVECKNYSDALSNTEYSQMLYRCNRRSKHFGIILCRDVKKRAKANAICHNLWNDHEYLMIVLDDADLKTMLLKADAGDFEAVQNAVMKRVEEVRDEN